MKSTANEKFKNKVFRNSVKGQIYYTEYRTKNKKKYKLPFTEYITVNNKKVLVYND